MNERSHDILEQCKQVSEYIHRYFEDKLYLDNLENFDALSPIFKADMAIQLLLNELENMGIETNLEVEDVLSFSPYFDASLALRRKFDSVNFYQTLMELDEKYLQRVQSIQEEAVCGEDLFIGLIEFFRQVLPMDRDWAILNSVVITDHFEGTSAFADYFSSILKRRLKQDMNRSYVDDSNINNVIAFTNNMKERDDRITVMISELEATFPELNKGLLDEFIQKYDKDKLAPECLPFFAAWYVLKDKPKEEPPFLAHHHATVSHHLQYWENPVNAGKKISKEQAVMIVVSMVLDGFDAKKRKEEVKPFFKYCNQDVQDFLTKIADFTYSEETSKHIPTKKED